MTEESLESLPKRDELRLADYLAFYATFRDYAKHEDNLVNNRLTWILTIHGFLYATYGFTLQKELEVLYRPDKPIADACYTLSQSYIFLFIITLVGATISIVGFLSIRAAKRSLEYLDTIFQRNTIHVSINFDSKKRKDPRTHLFAGQFDFPSIQGGGRRSSIWSGFAASTAIPLILLGSWLASAIILLVVYNRTTVLLCSVLPSLNDLRFFLGFLCLER